MRSGRRCAGGTRYGMPALRILRLARTIRWAIVGSGTRNARAISGVVRPTSVRNVERDLRLEPERGVATGEDEPQPVVVDAAVVDVDHLARLRIVRLAGCEHRDLLELGRSALARRNRSMATLRAVVVNHATGVRGTPSRGQVSSARANASCAHSSARSQSPVTRISVATTRPQSSRNATARARSTSGATSPRSASLRSSRSWRRGSWTRPRWPRRGPWSPRGRSRPSAPWSRRTGRPR